MKESEGSNWRRIRRGHLDLAKGICAAAFFSAILSMFQLALPLYSMQIFDRVLPSDSMPTLVTISLVMVGLALCSIIIDASRSIILCRVAEHVDQRIRRRATAVMIEGGGDAFLRDTETLKGFLAGPLAPILLDAPWSLGFLLAIFALHPLLGWITVAASCLMLICGTVLHLTTHRLRVAASAANYEVNRITHHARLAIDETAVMGIRGRVLEHILEAQTLASLNSLAMGERHAWVDSVSRGLRGTVQMGVMAFATWLVLSDGLQTGAIVATSMLFARALSPIERISVSFYSIFNVLNAYRRTRVSLRDSTGQKFRLSLPPIKGGVVLDNVTFFIVGRERPVLNRVCLTVLPGQVVVIVGREGAGKSSLARLLVGIEKPTSGCVRVDGHNLNDFDPESLGCQLGFLSEGPGFMHGTVAEIIARTAVPDSTLVYRAATLAGVHSLIQSLPRGYQTEVGDNPSPLSSGQIQRLALARAFYGDPRVLVLDEPTMHLDDNGEAVFLAAVRELKSAGTTVIIVSRFPALIHCADHLVMLDAGTVTLSTGHADMQRFLAPRLAT